jgi:hypothetical protein
MDGRVHGVWENLCHGMAMIIESFSLYFHGGLTKPHFMSHEAYPNVAPSGNRDSELIGVVHNPQDTRFITSMNQSTVVKR